MIEKHDREVNKIVSGDAMLIRNRLGMINPIDNEIDALRTQMFEDD